MQWSFIFPKRNKAWLFHKGQWFTIDDPLTQQRQHNGPTNGSTRRTSQSAFRGYALTSWTLGPTFLQPDYSGFLVYVYAYVGLARKPLYLILLEGAGTHEIVYAEELPDLLEFLRSFAPVVQTAFLIDIYGRR